MKSAYKSSVPASAFWFGVAGWLVVSLLGGHGQGWASEAEPNSGVVLTATTLPHSIFIIADDLTLVATAVGATEPCSWDFGDGTRRTGNPLLHEYAGPGAYRVTVECGAMTAVRSVTVASPRSPRSWPLYLVASSGFLMILVALLASRHRPVGEDG